MTFSEGGNFGGDRVRSRRGGRGVAVGGGIGLGAVVVVLVGAFFGVDLSGVLGAGGGSTAEQGEGTVGDCTAEQANTDRRCRLSATIDGLDTYWAATLPAQAGVDLALPEVVEFSDATSTGCGQASSSTGPFYCPPDATIYLDLTFFDLLSSRFGASGGSLGELYVIAHEYGHHVQALTGVFDRADRSGTGADSDSVRTELQADCYAGLWIGDATTTVDPDTGVPYLEPITAEELSSALSAAQAAGRLLDVVVADGGVDPDTWTHGSSAQRERWFTTGYEGGDLARCDTFAAADLG